MLQQEVSDEDLCILKGEKAVLIRLAQARLVEARPEQGEPPQKRRKSNAPVDPYVENPQLLIGKHVRHFFVNEDGE